MESAAQRFAGAMAEEFLVASNALDPDSLRSLEAVGVAHCIAVLQEQGRLALLALLKQSTPMSLGKRQSVANVLGRALRNQTLPARPLGRPATGAPAHSCVVISLDRRADRRTAFLQHWQGSPPRFSSAVDGAELATRRDVPWLGPKSTSTSRLLDDWRAAMCEVEQNWGSEQPRKLAAVAGCHCSHLALWEEMLADDSPDDSVLFVFEDDARLVLPPDAADLSSWFHAHISPNLSADWELCYLSAPRHTCAMNSAASRRTQPGPMKQSFLPSPVARYAAAYLTAVSAVCSAPASATDEPLKLIEARDPDGRAGGTGALPHPAMDSWTAVCASDEAHPAAACVRHVDGVPTTEAYALRRAGARRLVRFSQAHGLGAVDYVIAKAFATTAPQAWPLEVSAEQSEQSGVTADGRGGQHADLSRSGMPISRVFLLDPPIACQPQKSDSDIQNYMVFAGQEMHLRDVHKLLLLAKLAKAAGAAHQPGPPVRALQAASQDEITAAKGREHDSQHLLQMENASTATSLHQVEWQNDTS